MATAAENNKAEPICEEQKELGRHYFLIKPKLLTPKHM